jgi:hypothetical protein
MLSQACPPNACTITSSAARAWMAFFWPASSVACGCVVSGAASMIKANAPGKTLRIYHFSNGLD